MKDIYDSDNSLYYFCSFSVGWKLFHNKKMLFFFLKASREIKIVNIYIYIYKTKETTEGEINTDKTKKMNGKW